MKIRPFKARLEALVKDLDEVGCPESVKNSVVGLLTDIESKSQIVIALMHGYQDAYNHYSKLFLDD